MKVDKDELYLMKDFTDEQLDIVRDRWCETVEDMDKMGEDEWMFEQVINLINKLIEEKE